MFFMHLQSLIIEFMTPSPQVQQGLGRLQTTEGGGEQWMAWGGTGRKNNEYPYSFHFFFSEPHPTPLSTFCALSLTPR